MFTEVALGVQWTDEIQLSNDTIQSRRVHVDQPCMALARNIAKALLVIDIARLDISAHALFEPRHRVLCGVDCSEDRIYGVGHDWFSPSARNGRRSRGLLRAQFAEDDGAHNTVGEVV